MLAKKADEALLDSQKSFDNDDLFIAIRGAISSNCDQEIEEMFCETNTKRKDELLR